MLAGRRPVPSVRAEGDPDSLAMTVSSEALLSRASIWHNAPLHNKFWLCAGLFRTALVYYDQAPSSFSRRSRSSTNIALIVSSCRAEPGPDWRRFQQQRACKLLLTAAESPRRPHA